jgi:MFS family permease
VGLLSRWQRPPSWLITVLTVSLIVHTAVYAVRPMVSYSALGMGAGPAALGVIAGAFAAFSLVCAIPIGRWVDGLGELPFVLGGAGLLAVTMFALALADTLVLLGAVHAVLGLGHIVLVVGTQAMLANRSAPDRRDAVFGGLTVAVSGGQLAGPALAGVLAGPDPVGDRGGAFTGPFEGVRLVFVLAALAAAVAAVLGAAALARRRRPPAEPLPRQPRDRHPAASGRATIGSVLRGPGIPHAMLASMAVLSSTDLLIAYLPAYGEATGMSAAMVGLLLTTRAAASLVSRLFMTMLIRTLGRRRLLVASAALPALTLVAFPLVDAAPAQFLVMALAGLGLGLGQPLSLAWVTTHTPRASRGTAVGVRLTGNRLAQIAVPAAVGGLTGLLGPATIFWSLGVILAASAMASARIRDDDSGYQGR